MSGDDSSSAPVPIRHFLRETMIYGQVDLFDKLIGFVLLPITTALLTPYDYGVLSLFGTTSYLTIVAFSMGLPNGFFRFYTETTDADRQRRILDTTFRLISLCSAAWFVLLFLFATPLNRWIFGSGGRAYVIFLIAISYLTAVETLGRHRLQADHRPWTYLWVSAVSIVTVRSLSLLMIALGWGALGWVIGKAVGLSVTVVLMALFALRGLGMQYDGEFARKIAPYSLALVPGIVAHWFMVGCDKYLIRSLVDAPYEQIGFYGVGERISSIMQLITMAFLLGWRRFAFTNMHHPEGPQLVGRGIFLFVVAGGYAALGLSMLGDDLTHWLIASRYERGVVVIPALTLAGYFSGFAEMVAIGLHKANRTCMLSVLNALAAACNVALGLFFIPRYGIMGAAYSTLACQIVKSMLIWYTSHRSFAFPFQWIRAAVVTVFYALVFAGGQWLDAFGWIVATAGQTALVAVVPGVLWAVGFFTPNETAAMRSLLAASRGRSANERS